MQKGQSEYIQPGMETLANLPQKGPIKLNSLPSPHSLTSILKPNLLYLPNLLLACGDGHVQGMPKAGENGKQGSLI